MGIIHEIIKDMGNTMQKQSDDIEVILDEVEKVEKITLFSSIMTLT